MKNLTRFASLAFFVACVTAIVVLTLLGDTVPTVLELAAVGALTGQFAILAVSSVEAPAAAFVAAIAIGIVAGAHDTVPTMLTGLLVAALTGHFALQLPSSIASTTTPATATDTTTPVTATSPVLSS